MSRTYPSTYEAPIWRLIKYMLIMMLIGMVLGATMTVIAYETSWWQQIATALWMFHVTNWGLLGLYSMFGLITIVAVRHDQKKKAEQKKRQKLIERLVYNKEGKK